MVALRNVRAPQILPSMKIFEHSQNKILAAGIFKRALKHAGDVSSEVNFLCITQVAITILYYKLTQGNIKPGSGC